MSVDHVEIVGHLAVEQVFEETSQVLTFGPFDSVDEARAKVHAMINDGSLVKSGTRIRIITCLEEWRFS